MKKWNMKIKLLEVLDVIVNHNSNMKNQNSQKC